MKDQYGEQVPNDLMQLACGPDRFDDDELEIIINASWYEITHSHGVDLAVSFSEIEGVLDGNYPLGDTPIEVLRIDDILKRWSIEDGFYHA